MKFRLEIGCDNAAFEDNQDAEIAQILLDTSRRWEDRQKPTSFPLYDTNGNRVGRAWIEE